MGERGGGEGVVCMLLCVSGMHTSRCTIAESAQFWFSTGSFNSINSQILLKRDMFTLHSLFVQLTHLPIKQTVL